MNCENCDNVGKIKYQYVNDAENTDPTIFCDECFDLMVKLNRGIN